MGRGHRYKNKTKDIGKERVRVCVIEIQERPDSFKKEREEIIMTCLEESESRVSW